MHKKGETVTIINQNMSGAPIIEGDALLIKCIDTELYVATDGKQYFLERWEVMFDNGYAVVRRLYPQCDIDAIKQ